MSSRELLGEIYLFSELDVTELEKVMALCREVRFSANETIFDENEPGDKFYVIVDGRVRIRKMIPGIGEGTMTMLSKGEFFGEMALINDCPRSATVVAEDNNVTLLSIDRKDFLSLLQNDKDLAYKLLMVFIRTLSKRLQETNERIVSFMALAKTF